jgi:hypothetical protein
MQVVNPNNSINNIFSNVSLVELIDIITIIIQKIKKAKIINNIKVLNDNRKNISRFSLDINYSLFNGSNLAIALFNFSRNFQ